MAIDIAIPEFPESISEGTIGSWIKNVGDSVVEGETIVEIETDKVVLEIPAPANGVVEKILKQENDTVGSHEVIGQLVAQQSAGNKSDSPALSNEVDKPQEVTPDVSNQPVANNDNTYKKTSPSVRKQMHEQGVELDQIEATGKNNRVTSDDVAIAAGKQVAAAPSVLQTSTVNQVERVPMSSLRKRISERLVSAQQEYAMLTTFNEVNMQEVMSIRAKHKASFEEKHGVKLGFMSFFALAAVEALKAYPIMNASIDADDIVYHQYIDIGIAVSSERGLVVPIVRGADSKSFANIEVEINQLAVKARENKLSIDELVGGTFTLTNGGVFGSMLSTPIVNPPQSAILGMHAIEKRPVVIDDEITIAPMMYLALSYDHRIIDGREAVLFLSRIKQIIENPIQLLLHI